MTSTRDFSFVKLTSNSANRARAAATNCRNCSNPELTKVTGAARLTLATVARSGVLSIHGAGTSSDSSAGREQSTSFPACSPPSGSTHGFKSPIQIAGSLDRLPIVGNYSDMSAALTGYWQDFINQMIASGRYNNRSEVIRAGLRSLEERELAKEAQEFDKVFAGGRAGEPDAKTLDRIVARQKSHRKARR